MPVKPITIEQATPEQRFDYCKNFLQLEVRGNETATEIDALIAKAQPGQTMMFIQEPDTPEDVAAAETGGAIPLRPEEGTGKQTGSLGKGDPRCVIMIPVQETQDGSGSRDVLVGVNGRGWQLKRGVDLPVPYRVVAALDSAVADLVTHRQDEGHEGDVVITPSKRFNYQWVEKPSQDAIDEWLERTGKQFCA